MEWTLKSVVLEFKYFPSPHNQWTTAELIINTLMEFHLHTKTRAITSDSASEMIAVMRNVKKDLEQRQQLDLSDYHVKCIRA